ncbi:MAG: hypothetical protein GY750_05275 [Lentisphaerae bacterium]|nr:hypothetical protein [Lentisphaerota bacterium]MCP4100825.1 hypothetical protein [Lentisphaerota bacterium]
MDIVFSTILKDRTIRGLIRERRKLKDYVHHYVNRDYAYLNVYFPNLLNTLKELLAPGILAYYCYVHEIDIFFPRGWLTWKMRHVNKNVEEKVRELFGHIEAILPMSSGDLRNFADFKTQLDERLNWSVSQFRTRHTLHNHSFWNLCQIFYGNMPDNICLMPCPDGLNKFYVKSFSERNYQELNNKMLDIAHNFIKNNPKTKLIGIDQTSIINNNMLYPDKLLERTLQDFGYNLNYQVSKDLLTYGIQVDTWEILSYYSPWDKCHQYLPMKEAAALSYYRIYKSMSKRSIGAGVREVAMRENFKFLIKQITFLIGVYGVNGAPTDNALFILNEIDTQKRGFRNKKLTPRGYCASFWNQKSQNESFYR